MTGDTQIKTRPKQGRALQRRAQETQTQILKAATELFSSLGYDGISVRTIEAHAGVKRGLVAYHFETKEKLWLRVVDDLFVQMDARFAALTSTLLDLNQEHRIRTFISAFVRFCADVPEHNRLMGQEGKNDSWRLKYLVETHVRLRYEQVKALFGREITAHDYYIMIGASAFVFDAEFECRYLFDVDPKADEFIRAHAGQVAEIVVGEGG